MLTENHEILTRSISEQVNLFLMDLPVMSSGAKGPKEKSSGGIGDLGLYLEAL